MRATWLDGSASKTSSFSRASKATASAATRQRPLHRAQRACRGSAGGFVVAATVTHADFWTIGQFRPVGDTVRFHEVSLEEAVEADRAVDESLTDANVEAF